MYNKSIKSFSENDFTIGEIKVKLIPLVNPAGSFYDKIPSYPAKNNPIITMPNQLLLAETEKYHLEADTYAMMASEESVINGNICEYFVTEYNEDGAQNFLKSEDMDTKIVRSFNLMVIIDEVPDHTTNMSSIYGLEDMNIGTFHIAKLHFQQASTYASKISEDESVAKGFLVDDTKRFDSIPQPKIGDLVKLRLDEVLYKIIFVDDGSTDEGDFLSRQAYFTIQVRKYIDTHQDIADVNGMQDVIADQIGDIVNQNVDDDKFNINDYIKDKRDEIIYDDTAEAVDPQDNSNTVGKWFR